jgi:hypothetical protein
MRPQLATSGKQEVAIFAQIVDDVPDFTWYIRPWCLELVIENTFAGKCVYKQASTCFDPWIGLRWFVQPCVFDFCLPSVPCFRA